MPKYVLDTHLYIEATRSADANEALIAFYTRHTPSVWLHSVVAAELLAGAVARGLEARTRRSFLAPLEDVGRVITPSHASWKRGGAILAELVRRGNLSPCGFTRSLFNDCVIAASARESGFVLITSNARDFDRISEVAPVQREAPWPQPRP